MKKIKLLLLTVLSSSVAISAIASQHLVQKDNNKQISKVLSLSEPDSVLKVSRIKANFRLFMNVPEGNGNIKVINKKTRQTIAQSHIELKPIKDIDGNIKIIQTGYLYLDLEEPQSMEDILVVWENRKDFRTLKLYDLIYLNINNQEIGYDMIDSRYDLEISPTHNSNYENIKDSIESEKVIKIQQDVLYFPERESILLKEKGLLKIIYLNKDSKSPLIEIDDKNKSSILELDNSLTYEEKTKSFLKEVQEYKQYDFIFSYEDNQATITAGNSGTIPNWYFKDNKIIPVTSIESWAFFEKNIGNIIIPSNIKNIKSNAFRGSGAKSLRIESQIQTIEESAFASNQINKVELPSSVRYIKNSAFSYNDIEEIELNNNILEIEDSAFTGNKIKNLTIPSSLTKISFGAFANNKIESLFIPPNIKEIADSAFMINEISSLQLSEGLTKIGESSFFVNNLTYVSLPKSLEQKKESSFDSNVYFNEDNQKDEIQINGNFLYFKNRNSLVIKNRDNISINLLDSNSLNPLENISDEIATTIIDFLEKGEYNKDRKEIILDEYKTYNQFDFEYSLSNEEISITSGKSGIIPDYIYDNNKIYSVTEIRSDAFRSKNINEISIPDTVKKIGNSAFKDNKIEELIMPRDLIEISAYAFKDNKITNIVFNNQIKTIGYYSFANNLLQELKIPETIQTIEGGSFSNNMITKLNLHSNIKQIKRYAFSKNLLKDLELPNSLEVIEIGAFKNNEIIELKISSDKIEDFRKGFDKEVLFI